MSALYYTTIFFMLSSSAGLPVGVPPAPEDPRMARVAPDDCLFYTTWSGTAKADSDQANHTERLFAEPQLHRFVSCVLKGCSSRNCKSTLGAKGAPTPCWLSTCLDLQSTC